MADLTLSNPNLVYYRFGTFNCVNTDIPANGAGPNYYGFINLSGQYYILRESISSTVTTYDYYTSLAAGGVYATSWTGRAGLSYARYDTAFAILG